MKNILIILMIALGVSMLNAQVAIERVDLRGDAIMDFPAPATKGILLPRVVSNVTTPQTPGAMAFNLDSQQIEIYHPVNGWESMTEASETLIGSLNDYYTELDPVNGVLVFDEEEPSNDVVGVLVLESDTKALLLPQVEDVRQLPSPEAGMIAYDMTSQSIAIFNGSVWSYWN